MKILQKMRSGLQSRLKGFAKDVSGSIAVEAVVMLPVMLWVFLASFVYFDAFRQSTVNLKAANTIGDMLSRETAAVTDEYVSSMHSLMTFLTKREADPSLRISVAMWEEEDDMYHLDWSEGRGNRPAMTESQLNAIRDTLPILPDNERIILVETWSTYKPAFNVGMKQEELYNRIFTSPRFAPQVAWAD